MLPNFIGIGAPKAGTTWLFRILQEHPDVYMAPVKETKFFDDESIEGRGVEYERHFTGAADAKAVGEISVRYLASERGAAERIKAWIPNVRLFVSLRNPVDQMWSHYWHLRRQNFHQQDGSSVPASLERAIEKFPEHLLFPACYGKHLQHWLSHFESNQLHVLFYDDIVEAPERVARRLYSFLDVAPDFLPPSIHTRDSSVRAGTSPRSEWLGAAHRSVYSGLQKFIYSPLKRTMGAWRAHRIKDALRVRQVMEGLFMRRGYPALSDDDRARLWSLVKEDIREVERITGRSLQSWRYGKGANG